jgi:hypothetical protein
MAKTIQLGYRKIQKLSKAHYINLPWLWMHNNNAKQGDCVQVRLEKDGSLNISVAPVTAAKHATDAATPDQ